MRNRKAFEHVMSNVRLRREYRKMKKLAFATGAVIGSIGVMAAFSGCGGFHATIGTTAGIKEYHRGQNGLITNGKSSDDADSSYWQSDRHNEVETTERDPFYNFTRTIKGPQGSRVMPK
jgi:hypothetical protein